MFAGDSHVMLIREDGSAWTVGDNSAGQLGINAGGPASSSSKLLREIFGGVYARENAPPVADAGPDISRPDGNGDSREIVELDASNSTDDWQTVS